MQLELRHWILGLLAAVLVHAGTAVAVLRQMPETRAASVAGDRAAVSLGRAGQATGAVATTVAATAADVMAPALALGVGAAATVSTPAVDPDPSVHATAVSIAASVPGPAVDAAPSAPAPVVSATAPMQPSASPTTVPVPAAAVDAEASVSSPAADMAAPVRTLAVDANRAVALDAPVPGPAVAAAASGSAPADDADVPVPAPVVSLARAVPATVAATAADAATPDAAPPVDPDANEQRAQTLPLTPPGTMQPRASKPAPTQAVGPAHREPVEVARIVDAETAWAAPVTRREPRTAQVLPAEQGVSKPPLQMTRHPRPESSYPRKRESRGEGRIEGVAPPHALWVPASPAKSVQERERAVEARGDLVASINQSRGSSSADAGVDTVAVQRSVGGAGGQEAGYLAKVRAWLARHKRYPRRAQLLGQEGTGLVYLALDREGNVQDYEVRRSTGHEMLDRAIVTMIERARPMPPMPDSLTRSRLELVLPVEFVLQ